VYSPPISLAIRSPRDSGNAEHQTSEEDDSIGLVHVYVSRPTIVIYVFACIFPQL